MEGQIFSSYLGEGYKNYADSISLGGKKEVYIVFGAGNQF